VTAAGFAKSRTLTEIELNMIDLNGIHYVLTQINKLKHLLLLFKRFDGGNCNNGGFTVPKSKREGGQDRRKAGIPRTNVIGLG
jgi:hypothetical protein